MASACFSADNARVRSVNMYLRVCQLRFLVRIRQWPTHCTRTGQQLSESLKKQTSCVDMTTAPNGTYRPTCPRASLRPKTQARYRRLCQLTPPTYHTPYILDNDCIFSQQYTHACVHNIKTTFIVQMVRSTDPTCHGNALRACVKHMRSIPFPIARFLSVENIFDTLGLRVLSPSFFEIPNAKHPGYGNPVVCFILINYREHTRSHFRQLLRCFIISRRSGGKNSNNVAVRLFAGKYSSRYGTHLRGSP